MTIEEAIKILKQEPDFSLRYYIRENAIDVLLTAYEKQQKEIEKLNKKIQRIYDTQSMIDISDISKSHISFN